MPILCKHYQNGDGGLANYVLVPILLGFRAKRHILLSPMIKITVTPKYKFWRRKVLWPNLKDCRKFWSPHDMSFIFRQFYGNMLCLNYRFLTYSSIALIKSSPPPCTATGVFVKLMDLKKRYREKGKVVGFFLLWHNTVF